LSCHEASSAALMLEDAQLTGSDGDHGRCPKKDQAAFGPVSAMLTIGKGMKIRRAR
jgi:hypothetical protein